MLLSAFSQALQSGSQDKDCKAKPGQETYRPALTEYDH